MYSVSIKGDRIVLGRQGENLARRVPFSKPTLWREQFGEGKAELLHQRNSDEAPYPVVLTVENGVTYWNVSSTDTAIAGEGKCELRYRVGDVIVKSHTFRTTVLSALGNGTEEPPESAKPWVDQVLDAAEDVKNATTHQPIIGENGNWFTWDAETSEYIDTGVSAKGSGGGNYDVAHIETRPISLVGITTSSNPDTSIIEENKLTSTTTASTQFYIDYQGQSDIEVIPTVRATLVVDGKTVGSLSANTPFSWTGIVNEQIRVSFRGTSGEITFTKFLGDVYVDGLMSGKQLRRLENARTKDDPVYVDEYVTPEQYGAVGDGTADDSAAIQAAIDTNKRVVLSKTYRIENTINIKKSNQIFTIDGKIIVACDVGIELTGARNTIDGGGTIEVNAAMSESTAIRIFVAQNGCFENVISVRKLISKNEFNNIGIEITGEGKSGNGWADRITSDIENFRCAIWVHDIREEHTSKWYNPLYIHSAINKCIQAVVLDDACDATVIDGHIQPIYTTHSGASVASSLPLVKVVTFCQINATIWDTHLMANKSAVEVNGYYVYLNSPSPTVKDYYDIPDTYAKYTRWRYTASYTKEETNNFLEEKADKKDTANAVTGHVWGEVVKLPDVSPMAHNIKVKANANTNVVVDRINLLPYPYNDTTKTIGGITYTDNGDGSVTVKGTAMADNAAQFYLARNTLPVFKDGVTYYFSNLLDKGMVIRLAYGDENGTTKYTTTSITWNKAYTFKMLYLDVKVGGTTFDNDVIVPAIYNAEGEDGLIFATNESGEVEIPSLYPSMKLRAETEGVTLDVRYNRDVDWMFGDKKLVEQIEYNSTDGALQGRVYVVDKTNTQTSKELRVTNVNDSIPVRNHRGNFYVGTPTIALECTNKQYVDDLFKAIEDRLKAGGL